MYTHFIGRIGKDGAKVINGNNGQFLSMDVATDIYSKGENRTLWVRVRSNRENHIKLAQWLTKGRMLLIEGTQQEPGIWTDKNGTPHTQLIVTADLIDFVKMGKKKENADTAAPMVETPEGKPVQDISNAAPEDKDSDIPF